MTNFLLADEINRASPKTQSALLEVMQEGRISIDGNTHNVPQPFIVMATQNPVGSSGTQELPESQTDRFMVRLTVGYPRKEDELQILKGTHLTKPSDLTPVITASQLLTLRQEAASVHVDDSLYAYMVSIANATRTSESITLGISPRGTMALASMTKAHAFLAGRDYAVPDDILQVAADTLPHRILLSGKAQREGETAFTVLQSILRTLPLPKLMEA